MVKGSESASKVIHVNIQNVVKVLHSLCTELEYTSSSFEAIAMIEARKKKSCCKLCQFRVVFFAAEYNSRSTLEVCGAVVQSLENAVK